MFRDLDRDVPTLEKLYAGKLWADFSFPGMASLSAIEIKENNNLHRGKDYSLQFLEAFLEGRGLIQGA